MTPVIKEWNIIWYFFRDYKLRSSGVLALMFLSGFLESANLAALYPVINYGLDLGKKDVVLENFERAAAMVIPGNPFLVACSFLILISIISVGFKILYNYSSNSLMIKIVGDTQKKIFEQFIAADYGFYVKNQQGNLIYAGTIAPDKATNIVIYSLGFVYNLINSIFLFSLLVMLSWQATVFILILGGFYGVVIRQVMQSYIKKCAAVSVEQSQRKNIILNEFISGIKTIKIFMAVEEWRTRYMHSVDTGLRNQFRMVVAGAFPEIFVKFLFYILIAVTGIVFSLRPHSEIVLMLPILGTFVMVVNRFLPSIYVIGAAVMKIAEAMPGSRIVHDLCTQSFVAGADGSRDLVTFSRGISFENIWFKYGAASDYLLKAVTFSVEKKKMTAIVGLSGSGKTTLIHLLLKLYRVDKGAIRVDGIDIQELRNSTYLSRIGYVSQETFIFNNTIRENIRFGMADCTDQMIEAAARIANAHDFIMASANGYGSIVGDSGIKLSGGQRQRVAIARAMLRKPEIIVLDEATSSLDNISEKKIQTAINNISKHTTVLVIAHRLSTVQGADKIIILERGEIREQGTHEELMNNKSLYYDLHVSNERVDEALDEKPV